MRVLACIAVASLLVFGGAALADRTVTFRAAGAEVVSMHFDSQVDGGVRGTICGRARQDDAGFGPESCYSVETAGQTRADILNFRNARAIPFWIQQEAL